MASSQMSTAYSSGVRAATVARPSGAMTIWKGDHLAATEPGARRGCTSPAGSGLKLGFTRRMCFINAVNLRRLEEHKGFLHSHRAFRWSSRGGAGALRGGVVQPATGGQIR